MISLVTGKIGSGKTLHCVGLIVKHLSKGGTVYTNIRLNFDEVQKVVRKRHRRLIVPEQINYVDLVESDKWQEMISWGVPELPVLCLWDEVHLFFNARDWSKTAAIHKPMLSFLSQSRKACVDVIFIAQVASTLEKQFRVQCEWEFYCRKLKDIPIPLLGSLPIDRMLLVQKDSESDKPISRKIVAYERDLWRCYDTRSFLDAEMRDASSRFSRIAPVALRRVPLVRKRTVIGLLVALLVLIFHFYAIL